jgi:hypothetical protein
VAAVACGLSLAGSPGCGDSGRVAPMPDAGPMSTTPGGAPPSLDPDAGAAADASPTGPDAGAAADADGAAMNPGADAGAGVDANPAPRPPPTVSNLQVPPGAGGMVPMAAAIRGVRALPVQIDFELSRDGGATFGPATIAALGATAAHLADAGGDSGQITATWNAAADLGKRAVATVTFRVRATDGQGAGPPALFTVAVDNLRAAARNVDYYLANYGAWSTAAVAVAWRHQLVIVHPGQANITRAAVANIQMGADASDPTDDVLVLCYVSVGEDLRTRDLTDDQVRVDPRFHGDGSGPRIDPRGGPAADGTSLSGIDPRGAPSSGGTGFASYYLDDNDVHNSANHVGDGFPDRNQIFGSLFVNAGDPAWFDVVDAMTLDGADQHAGLREVLTTAYGRGLGCDGVFLDTIDTAAPNYYTDASSPNQTEFEWTAPGFGAFIRHVHQAYPDKLILQNRGLFFFDPRHPQYAFNARGAIDFLLFESFRLDSNSFEQWNPVFYPDNRYNVGPKLMAEADRPDGFRVLSLGYADGPDMSTDTLLGQSTLGLDSLMEDIRVTQEVMGFRHYLTDASVTVVNDFVRTHASLDDQTPPQWSSTYNDHTGSPAIAPTPRVGIQQAVGTPGSGSIDVRWDVALDMNRVSYVLYAQAAPFDFVADPRLSHAARIPLVPAVPADYLQGVGPSRYPNQMTVSGFPAGQMQYLLIRAVDQSPAANQDDNTVVLTAIP